MSAGRRRQPRTGRSPNRPFAEWMEVLGSERLTGALLDRLTHHVHVLEMNGGHLPAENEQTETCGRTGKVAPFLEPVPSANPSACGTPEVVPFAPPSDMQLTRLTGFISIPHEAQAATSEDSEGTEGL